MSRTASLAIACIVLACQTCLAQTQLVSTVINKKTAEPVTGLAAQDFRAVDDKAERIVRSVQVVNEPVDAMLLIDGSLVGEAVRPIANLFIDQLEPKEEMALVEFASSANLVQDFTSSKQMLKGALATISYGNEPKVLDALYAAIDGGFGNSSFRRVVFLLTTGYEGSSHVNDPKTIIHLARKNGVTIYPVYLVGAERSLMEELAAKTGGASFRVSAKDHDLAKTQITNIVRAARSHYLLSLDGNKTPGEKFRLTVTRPEKLFVSAMPLD